MPPTITPAARGAATAVPAATLCARLAPPILLDEAGIKVLELLFVKATDDEPVLARGAEVLTSDELV